MAEYVGSRNDAGDIATRGDVDDVIRVADSAPSNPNTGDLWFESDTGTLYIYYDNQWVSPSLLAGSVRTAAASTITGTNAEGTASTLARADHNHAISETLLVPTGSVMPYAGATAPSSWLLCAGQEVNRTTYAALHAVLKDVGGAGAYGYGSGNGTTTFNLPDLRGRVPAGVDNMNGTAASRLTNTVLSASNALGATGGSQTHTLTEAQMPAHNHTINDPGHTHSLESNAAWFARTTGVNDPQQGSGNRSYVFGYMNTATTGITINNKGGGGAHANTQPTLTVNYIIKT